MLALQADLEIEAERCRVTAFVQKHFGRLDILINNAAFYPREKLEGWVAPFEEQRLEIIRRCIEVNLTAGFHLAQILVDYLRSCRGRIINIGSIYGVLGPDYSLYGNTGMGNPAAYAMSKGGLVQLSRWMATTLAPAVRVTGLIRALYATYISYLPNEKFSYTVPLYADSRGVFVEMLKTLDSGQFSYFTSHPGATRGGHYHHSKSEKFLVIKGEALFRFRHLLTNELVELKTNGITPKVVDTIPGWVHDITNVGDEEMVVMIWANEIFIRNRPDTVASKLL